VYLCVVSGRKSVYDLHSLHWHFQTRWTIEMPIGAFKAAMKVYISYKFGELSSTSALNVAQLCTAAFGLIHLRPPGGSTFVFRYYSLYRG